MNGSVPNKDSNKVDYTNAHREDQIRYFFALFDSCVAVKLYDADCDLYLLDYLKSNTHDNFNVYQLIGYAQTNNKIEITNHDAAIIEMENFIVSE
jgi:hypothetical protein